jgi:hypothetical protein
MEIVGMPVGDYVVADIKPIGTGPNYRSFPEIDLLDIGRARGGGHRWNFRFAEHGAGPAPEGTS